MIIFFIAGDIVLFLFWCGTPCTLHNLSFISCYHCFSHSRSDRVITLLYSWPQLYFELDSLHFTGSKRSNVFLSTIYFTRLHNVCKIICILNNTNKRIVLLNISCFIFLFYSLMLKNKTREVLRSRIVK